MATVFIFVEGDDDERFVNSVLRTLLLKKYTDVKTWQYSDKPREKIRKFLRTISQMNADLIFLADLDNHPCITKRKEDLVKHHPDLEGEKIFIVKPEIEGWYVSGVEQKKLHELGIDISDGVDIFTKEKLHSCLKTGMVRTEVLIELLREYSVAQARARSTSFAYVVEKRC